MWGQVKLTWLDKILKYGQLTELKREITTELIDYIYIGKNKSVRIVFTYADEYQQLMKYIERNTPITAKGS